MVQEQATQPEKQWFQGKWLRSIDRALPGWAQKLYPLPIGSDSQFHNILDWWRVKSKIREQGLECGIREQIIQRRQEGEESLAFRSLTSSFWPLTFLDLTTLGNGIQRTWREHICSTTTRLLYFWRGHLPRRHLERKLLYSNRREEHGWYCVEPAIWNSRPLITSSSRETQIYEVSSHDGEA